MLYLIKELPQLGPGTENLSVSLHSFSLKKDQQPVSGFLTVNVTLQIDTIQLPYMLSEWLEKTHTHTIEHIHLKGNEYITREKKKERGCNHFNPKPKAVCFSFHFL